MVPALAGVELSALRLARGALARGTCLEGTQITIDEPPGRTGRERCETGVISGSCGGRCPSCGGCPVRRTGGSEWRVVDLPVQDD